VPAAPQHRARPAGGAKRVTNHPRDTEEDEVAQSKRRRGQDVADEELDDVLDDTTDDDTDGVADDDEDEPVRGRRRGGTATKVKKAGPDADDTRTLLRSEERVGIFARLIRFVREVVAELKKVIWPTRKELLTYAAVVIVFVTVVVTIVALLDAGFEWAVLKVFAGKK
jgi:preprotein translocase subunit SecE